MFCNVASTGACIHFVSVFVCIFRECFTGRQHSSVAIFFFPYIFTDIVFSEETRSRPTLTLGEELKLKAKKVMAGDLRGDHVDHCVQTFVGPSCLINSEEPFQRLSAPSAHQFILR